MIGKALRGARGVSRGLGNLALRKMGSAMKPRYMWYGVTEACNCRCLFCHIWQNKPAKDVMSPEEAEKAFSDPLFSELEQIVISGGEPTLRPDLYELLSAIHRSVPEARFTVSTNGMLPERYVEVLDRLLTEGVDVEAGISLDALDEKRDELRGVPGSFEKVDRLMHEIVALREKHPRLRVSAGLVLIDATKETVEYVREYTKKLGVDLNIQWYNQADYYENTDMNLLTIDDRLREIIGSQPPSPMRDRELHFLDGGDLKFPCFALHTFVILKPTGEMAPCFEMWDDSIGDIRKTPASKLWKSEKAQKVRGKVKSCRGCLSDCGVEWSMSSSYLPYLSHKIKNSLQASR